MSASNSIISISQTQGDDSFLSYLDTINSFFTPEFGNMEIEARFPCRSEIYNSLSDSGIKIEYERKGTEGDFTIHIFKISDDESGDPEDLTIKHNSGGNQNEPVESIGRIKTYHRILMKLANKHCGSMNVYWAKDSILANPYFDAVMISKSGQQGLSFSKTGIKIKL